MAKNPISLERGLRIRAIREKLKLSRLQFEEMTGMSASTLKAFESGERDLSSSKARLFSNLFSSLFTQILGNDSYETSFDYIFHGLQPETLELDISGIPSNDAFDIEKEIGNFTINPSFIVLKIKDDLMFPIYKKEDIVVGRKITAENQFSLYRGYICILEPLKGETILRKIIKAEARKITSCILNTHVDQSVDVFEEIEVRCIAQPIRHWHLSEFVQTPPFFQVQSKNGKAELY
jgi:transcriptional regulator with XRE-family HTH domain